MQPIILPQPNIPQKYQFIIDLLQTSCRQLKELHPKFAEELNAVAEAAPIEFCLFEDIIDGVFKTHGNGCGQEAYFFHLMTALEVLWPPKQPEIVGKIVRVLGNRVNEVYVIDLNTLPQDLQEEIRRLEFPLQDNILTCLGVAHNAMAQAISKLDLSKDLGNKAGQLKRIISEFNKEAAKFWPLPKPIKPVETPKVKVRDGELLAFMESFFHYDAICDLIFCRFTNLDPVIGDEACEARPSALIDICEVMFSLIPMDELKCLAFGYQLRHCGDPDPAQFWTVKQRQREGRWSREFMDFCDGVLIPKCGGQMVKDYLTYCKANTLASAMVTDEWQIVSYDRDKGVYGAFKPECRSKLTKCSVVNIRNMAQFVMEKTPNPSLGQVCQVLHLANAAKMDGDKPILSLPIYETMRTVLAYELLKGRPLVVSINEIIVDQNAETYTLHDVYTLAYTANRQKGRFEIGDFSALDKNKPCLSFQCYRLVNVNQPILAPDGADFFTRTGHEFLEIFKTCDFALQTMIYAAIHPVLAGKAILEGETVEASNHGLDAELAWQTTAVGGNNFGGAVDFTRTSVNFSLLDPVCDLAAEYLSFQHLAASCGLGNKQLLTRPGGGQVCVRTLESCAFTIHHINLQSPLMVEERDNKARATIAQGPLLRYHNFDNRKSYGNMDDAKDKK
jgi:hypothetical protein